MEQAEEKEGSPIGLQFKTYSIDGRMEMTSRKRNTEGLQNVMTHNVENGWRCNIHVILSIRGKPSTWRSGRIIKEVNNVVIFNSTQYADEFDNSYYLKEMLKNITSDSGNESMAVWYGRKEFSKFRPFIYDFSVEKEKDAVTSLMRG